MSNDSSQSPPESKPGPSLAIPIPSPSPATEQALAVKEQIAKDVEEVTGIATEVVITEPKPSVDLPLDKRPVKDLEPHQLETERQRIVDAGRKSPEDLDDESLARLCEIFAAMRRTKAGPKKAKVQAEPQPSVEDLPDI